MTTAAVAAFRIPPLPARLRTAARALHRLFRDPTRLDQVLVFGQAINMRHIAKNLERLSADPDGARLLAEQPRIDRMHVDFDALSRLPDGTLGREYVRFLREHGITPDAFEASPDVGDARAAYVMLRIRQTHDLWHVLTGYEPDIRGELLLQAFSFAQLRVPSSFVLAVFGSIRFAARLPGRTIEHAREMRRAFERGKATSFLGTFRWEDHWATPVADLRTLLTCPA